MAGEVGVEQLRQAARAAPGATVRGEKYGYILGKFMKYNNGKTPSVGDKVICKPGSADMIAGTVIAIAAPYNLHLQPIFSTDWILAGAGTCLLQSDLPFGPVPPNPPL